MELAEAESKMRKAVAHFMESVAGYEPTLNASVIDGVKVGVLGGTVPLKNIATTAPAKGGVLVTAFDPMNVPSIEKALKSSGFNAGQTSKLTVFVDRPRPSGETRKEIEGHIRRHAEDARIAVRQVRQNAKKGLNGALPENVKRASEKRLQELTDAQIAEIDRIAAAKAAIVLGKAR